MHRVVKQVIVPVVVSWLGLFPRVGHGHTAFVKQTDGGYNAPLAVQLTADGRIRAIYFVGLHHIARLEAGTGCVVWSEKGPGLALGGMGSGPVLAGHVLVYASNAIYGLSLRTGKLKWRSYAGTLSGVGLAAGPGMVYTVMGEGWGEVAVNARDGKTEWTSFPKTYLGGPAEIRYFDGRLYANSPYVLDARTGRVLVRFSRRIDRTFNLSQVYHFELREGRIFAARTRGPVVAFDARSGRVLWTAPNPLFSPPGTAWGDRLVASDRYLVTVFYRHSVPFIVSHRALVQVYDAANGHLLWRKEVIRHNFYLPVGLVGIGNHFLYLVEPVRKGSKPFLNPLLNRHHNPHLRKATLERVVAYSMRTGKQEWTHVVPYTDLGVVPVGGMVLVSGSNQTLSHFFLVALNRTTGATLWKFSFHQPAHKCLPGGQ